MDKNNKIIYVPLSQAQPNALLNVASLVEEPVALLCVELPIQVAVLGNQEGRVDQEVQVDLRLGVTLVTLL